MNEMYKDLRIDSMKEEKKEKWMKNLKGLDVGCRQGMLST